MRDGGAALVLPHPDDAIFDDFMEADLRKASGFSYADVPKNGWAEFIPTKGFVVSRGYMPMLTHYRAHHPVTGARGWAWFLGLEPWAFEAGAEAVGWAIAEAIARDPSDPRIRHLTLEEWRDRPGKAALLAALDATLALGPAPERAAFGGDVLWETARRRLHLAVERRGGVSDRVKAAKGLVCEGCGLDAPARFGAELAPRCIEAHHLTPLSAQAEGAALARHPVRDFAVLCATCHRLIHALRDPADLPALRRIVGRNP